MGWEAERCSFEEHQLQTLHYQHIVEADDKWDCRVTRAGKGYSDRKCFFVKELEQGLAFSGCSCGIPYTDGIPCHHMVAVVKSSQIEGLMPTNAMSYWWSSECWRNQYPIDSSITCDFDMETLHNVQVYCGPQYTGRQGNEILPYIISCGMKNWTP
jgi:hypothetical protein